MLSGVVSELGSRSPPLTPFDDGETLIVTSFESTNTGFIAQFNQELDTSTLSLYDSEAASLGVADVFVQGGSTGPIFGSLVVGPNRRQITFVKTGGPFANDSYSVTLRSADNGIKSISGAPLDGDRDGISAGDFNQTFAVDGVATVTVSVPDFVRGPGQEVNVPANSENGIPVSISLGDSVKDVEMLIEYDPQQLMITGVTRGAAMPHESSVSLTEVEPGTAFLQFSSPLGLLGGDLVIANLRAQVPAENASEIYGRQGVLDLRSVIVRDLRNDEIPTVDDDGFHLTNYIADVTGNGRVNGSDASQIARFAAFLDTGFASHPFIDPYLLADVSGNRRINAADATWAALIGALFQVPGVPPIPSSVVIRQVERADNVVGTRLAPTKTGLEAHAHPALATIRFPESTGSARDEAILADHDSTVLDEFWAGEFRS